MLAHNDLKKGIEFILEGQPYEVLDSSFVFKGRGSSVVPAKIKNLISGAIIARTFHPGEKFEEAEIEKIKAKFLYCHRDNFFFCQENDSSAASEARNGGVQGKKKTKISSPRFSLSRAAIGESVIFLKENQIVEAIKFEEKIINIYLPIKVNLRAIEAPPGTKGDRAQSGNKIVILETGAQINAPLFIKVGDIIEVNTDKGEYVRRVE